MSIFQICFWQNSTKKKQIQETIFTTLYRQIISTQINITRTKCLQQFAFITTKNPRYMSEMHTWKVRLSFLKTMYSELNFTIDLMIKIRGIHQKYFENFEKHCTSLYKRRIHKIMQLYNKICSWNMYMIHQQCIREMMNKVATLKQRFTVLHL